MGVQECTLAGLGGLRLAAWAICRRELAFERALSAVLLSWQTLEGLYPLHSLRDPRFGCTLSVQNVGAVELHHPYDNWDVEAGDAGPGSTPVVLQEDRISVPVKEGLDLASFSDVLT